MLYKQQFIKDAGIPRTTNIFNVIVLQVGNVEIPTNFKLYNNIEM